MAKINMRLDKNPMPSQDPNVRNKNFLEVALGYTEEQALDEAARCLNCKNHPCVDGCPVNVRIPEFIAKIVERDYEGAYQVIHQTTSLPAVCGRVCPQESQCEMHCVRGKKGDPVGIGRLERFVADWHNAHAAEAAAKPASNGHKVAVVGSGPSGLTCAGDLAKKGYDVTVFEALHLAGGVLVYGIPEFRLPKTIVQKEVDGLKAMGVKVETEHRRRPHHHHRRADAGVRLRGRVRRLRRGSAHVHAHPRREPQGRLLRQRVPHPHQPDEGLPRGYRHAHHGSQGQDRGRRRRRQRGHGRRALLRSVWARRVYVVYRRGMEELPARHEEVRARHRRGRHLQDCSITPSRSSATSRTASRAMKCVEMELGEPDASGRRRPVEKKGSEFELPVDAVIMSLGTSPNPLIKTTTKGLEVNKKGGIIVNEDGLTTREGVYAGGDAVTGAATVILAMGAGKTRRKVHRRVPAEEISVHNQSARNGFAVPGAF